MQIVVFIVSLFATLNCLAAAPKVAHKVAIIDTEAFDTETGKKKEFEWTLTELEATAHPIREVRFAASIANTIVLTAFVGAEFDRSFFIQFSAHDSALAFKTLLVNSNESFLFVITARSQRSRTPAWDVRVWNSKTASLIPLGEVVGPLRSYDDQSVYGKALIHVLGRSLLNKINLNQPEADPQAIRAL